MYIKIKKPDNENPVCNIFEVIRYTYGKDLKILESEWKDFLNNSIEYNPVIDKFIMGRNFYKRIPIKAIHCASCGYPLKNRKEVCVECGFDNSLYK
jgi:ribosomal protein L37E